MDGARTANDGQASNHQQEADLFVPFDMPSMAKIGNSNVSRYISVLLNDLLIRSQSSHDYMRHWRINKERPYLDEILLHEISSTRNCSRCSTSLMDGGKLWRCKDCFSSPTYCRKCCRDAHRHDPFHRVEIWNKSHFTPTWLWRTGLVLSLCSKGRCSPPLPGLEFTRGLPDAGDITFGAKPAFRVTSDSVRMLTVVHTNGIHHVLVAFCTCQSDSGYDSSSDDVQLLRASLYPASDKDVRTAFTFAMLDHYLLDNLECYTSSLHFFSKLRRLTNEIYPKRVAVGLIYRISSERYLRGILGSLSRRALLREAVAQAQGTKASWLWKYAKNARKRGYGVILCSLSTGWS
jgi:CxC2 like cysteine cluster associated with KDZ transposases